MLYYCLVCGERLEQPTADYTRRYCSDTCRQKDWQELREWAKLAVDYVLAGKPQPPKDWRYKRYQVIRCGSAKFRNILATWEVLSCDV